MPSCGLKLISTEKLFAVGQVDLQITAKAENLEKYQYLCTMTEFIFHPSKLNLGSVVRMDKLGENI